VENVDTFFANATQHGATVKEDLKDQFWGDRTCALVDPFGHHWMFGTHVREVSPEEMNKAMVEMMAAHA